MTQPPMVPPPAPIGYTGPATVNSLAWVSLIAGVASFVVIPILGAIVAVITGHMARSQIRRSGEGGAGIALAGLVLGYVHLAITAVLVVVIVLLIVVFGVALFSSGATTPAH